MSQKIRCLIVDDEQIAREIVKNYVEKMPNLELVGDCKSPFEAFALLQAQTVDLIFLDIQMPELTGIEFFKSLQQKPMVIFTTAYSEYAIEGFQMDVVDYLLKPFRFDRFVEAVNKANRRWRGAQQSASVSSNSKQQDDDFMLVKADHKVHKIRFRDIHYIEGMKEYVAFHLSEGRILSIFSLKQLEKDLPADRFLRIHRSFIVAKDRVTALEANTVHLGKKKLPIGGNYKPTVLAEVFNLAQSPK